LLARAMESDAMDSGDMKVTSCMESRGMEEALDSEVTPISDMAPELLPDSVEVVPNSIEVLPNSVDVLSDSVDVVPDSVEVLPDSVEMVPDSIESMCPRCGTFHAGGVFGEACFQARRRARTYARCGLLHEDYDLAARILHDLDKFDCQIYIPDVDKLVMNGNNIMVPDHIMKTLDDQLKMKQDDEQLKMKHRFKKRKMMQIASMEEPNKDQ